MSRRVGVKARMSVSGRMSTRGRMSTSRRLGKSGAMGKSEYGRVFARRVCPQKWGPPPARGGCVA